MKIVVDASVALKWVLDEPGSDAAIDLLSTSELAMPGIFMAEAANALWRHVTRKQIEMGEALDRLARLRSVRFETFLIEEDIEHALQLAIDLNHPIYDCLYLALALRLDTHVVTADRRFVALSGRRGDLAGRVRALTP